MGLNRQSFRLVNNFDVPSASCMFSVAQNWLEPSVKFNYSTRKLAFFKALIYGERGRPILEWILMEMGAIKGPLNRGDPIAYIPEMHFIRNNPVGPRVKLTDDDDLDPGLGGAEPVDALARVDAGVIVIGVAHLQHVLVLAVPHPRYVVDRVAVLRNRSCILV